MSKKIKSGKIASKKSIKKMRGKNRKVRTAIKISAVITVIVLSVFLGSLNFLVLHNTKQLTQQSVASTKQTNTTALFSAATVSQTTAAIAKGAASGLDTFGFSIYTNLSTLLGQFKLYYPTANAADLLMDDAYNSPPRPYIGYYNHPQAFPRLILANNYSELTSTTSSPYVNDVALAKTYNFSSSDYIAYDSEDWSLTPASEQKSIVQYTQMSCNYVHAAGYKFAFTPEIDVPGWYSLTSWSNFNWTCINFLDLQEQYLSSNPTAMAKNVTQLVAIAKGDNPNLVVFVQIDMAGDSVSAPQAELESDILALSKVSGVNGVIIQDLCSSTSCNNELTTLIDYIGSVSANSGSTTSTQAASTTIQTTSTTITTTIPQKSPVMKPNPALILPTSVQASGSSGNVNVKVFGSGFTPGDLVNFGYTPMPPYTNSLMATTVNSTGGWSGTFTAPWTTGTYAMVAIDANGTSATATLAVTGSTITTAITSTATTTSSTTTITSGPRIILPASTSPSSASENIGIKVSGTGFTPGAVVNFGYTPLPPYKNALIAPIANSTGGWSGTFTAPWTAGTYTMVAVDSKGVSATSTLVVT